MSNMSISSYHNKDELWVNIVRIKDHDFYTMNVSGKVCYFVDTIEQLEKFAQDILLQVATLKNEQDSR